MVLLFLILLSILLFFAFVLFIPAELGIFYNQESDCKKFRIRLKLLGVPISFAVPAKKNTDIKKAGAKKGRKLKSPKEFIAFAKKLSCAYNEVKADFWELIYELKSLVTCKELYFNIHYGLNNPASTGILNGAIWTAGTLILKILDEMICIQKKSLNVYPDFRNEKINIHIKAVFSGKLFNVMLYALKVVKLVKTIKNKLDS